MTEEKKEPKESINFIEQIILDDLKNETNKIVTRFPPEPSGWLHLGHVKNILLNYNLAKKFGGKFNLRFDDTNPAKEEAEFVASIENDVRWLGVEFGESLHASNYFDATYECAITLIKKGLAFVCDLNSEEMKEYRGTLTQVGKNSPYRERSIEENLQLFEDMKNDKFKDGEHTLRAKIDMNSPNINMRDPIIYRIAHLTHHNTQDKWCIYPMYDFAHPIQDAIEGITHSICTLEFEAHRPLYDWVVANCCENFPSKPRQIESAKLKIANTIMGKRYIKNLVNTGVVDGWDDPRLATIAGVRRRGYSKEALQDFCEKIGVSKADNLVDYALLEYCVREDLKEKAKNKMVVLDPLKVVITNYPEGKIEYLDMENSSHDENLGIRQIPFGREIYIEREDFMLDAPSKFHRLTKDKEVRLKGAYFILCNEVITDNEGNITELHCTYDEETKSGSGFTGRKVKGTIHWVEATTAIPAKVRKFDFIVFDDENEESGYRENPNSLLEFNALCEPSCVDLDLNDRLQFIRNGYYCLDSKLSTKDSLVINEIVSLKNSFKLN
ncbi:MAG: glutamine--tRNA ligase/YqeY domain fusion protein [Lachnospirales bacterium]